MKKLALTVAGLVATSVVLADPLTDAAGGHSDYSSLIFLALFVLVFYFLLIRPQMKRSKAMRDMVSSLQVGDEVMTQGGMVGKIDKMEDSFIYLSVADNVTLKFQKQSIANVLPKGTLK